ncbi:MAG: hypothetical protein HPY70_12710 [Firmicutes bacterium]|jgi:hypothetical protein|nr:hypothetical protein [Bacillota bacterium]
MKRWMPTTKETVEALKKGFIFEPHINDPPYKYYVAEEMQKQEKKGKEKRDEDAQDTR